MKKRLMDGIRLVRRYRRKGLDGHIVRGDALKFLRSLPDEAADLVFLDPPFNLGKTYSSADAKLDNKPEHEYRSWLGKILLESSRVLKKGGALYLYHLPSWAMRLGASLEGDADLQFLHWIAISMKNGFIRGQRLYPAHYALLLFAKGKPKQLRRPKLPPARCRHCNRLIKDYGGYWHIIQEKGGLNLSDFWEDLSPVRHANKKHRSANELPLKLFTRVLDISGVRGGLYVDPFAGAGSGVLAAVRAGMRFAACDIVPANCGLIVGRLDDFRRNGGKE